MWIVAGALGLTVLTGVIFVKARGGDANPAPTSAGSEPTLRPTPTPSSDATPEHRGLDELDAFLLAHFADDPVACLRRLEKERVSARGTPNEQRIEELVRQYQDRVYALGKADFERKMEQGRRAEGDQRFGEALAALTDLPETKDPMGHWNGKLAEERELVTRTAREEWSGMAARARELAQDGQSESALVVAARGEAFGIPGIEAEARALRAEIAAVAARSHEEADPDGGLGRAPAVAPGPQAGPNPSSDDAGAKLLASLVEGADARPSECSMCRGVEGRAQRMCPTCQGGKRVACPMCKGTGAWKCPAGVHQPGNSFDGEDRDPAHVKKILRRCKTCDDKPERRCTGCRGSKTISCKPCAGKGRIAWTCPLVSMHGVASKAAAGACSLCQGQAQPPCPVCGGQGALTGGSCSTCADLGKAPCATCNGAGRAACERCGGSGRVRTLTKAGSSFDSETGASGWDPGGTPDASSCDMCDAKGFTPCGGCSRAGTVRCAACDGKQAGKSVCWACEGRKTLDRCPSCATGSLLCGRTSDGAALVLCSLRDLEPLLDRGVHGVLGSQTEWMVLVVDNREGKTAVTWTGDLAALTLRADNLTRLVSQGDVDRVAAFKRAVETDGRLFGLRPGVLAGSKVEAGLCATFLVPCAASPVVGKEAVLQSVDGSALVRLAQASLDASARQALLARYWGEEGMERR